VPSGEKLLTVPQAAERLGLKEGTLRVWMRQRRIARVYVGERAVRVPESEVSRLVSEGLVPAIRRKA
jgi:excisionase family DNA binding protein